MARWILPISMAALVVCQAGTLATCPSGYPNEIFCDDFDTYCLGGGHPGDPKCGSGAAKDDTLLHEVWMQTSETAGGGPCGTPMTVQDNTTYVQSAPFGGMFPGSKTDVLAQHTFRDWVHSTPGNDILNLSRIIGDRYGGSFTALAGMDAWPLVMSFALNSQFWGSVFYSDGFVELAYGPSTDPSNRANTDYVWGPSCSTYCSPYINQGPFPILCAQGNPDNGLPLPAACPVDPLNTAPVHSSMALGIFAMVDPDPCHCGSQGHGSTAYHPVFFDGQVWWNLRSNSPQASTGTVTPLGGAPEPPPADINLPGNFTLWGDPALPGSSPPVPIGEPHNRLTLTVKTTTVKIELTTIETSKAVLGARYQVYSVMDGIPRKYLGPFDTMRGGVGPGCQLVNKSWTSCAAARTCLTTAATLGGNNHSAFVGFDDLSLSGSVVPPAGACCLDNAECVEAITRAPCEDEPPAGLGGRWAGFGTACSLVTCCPVPFADSDLDGDVDADDFGAWQVCYTGDQTGVPTSCDCFDRDGDDKINRSDFTAFGRCWTGANVPWSQALTPNCTP